MKRYLLAFLLISSVPMLAQDVIINITPAMLNERGEVLLSDLDGWVFREGNHAQGADPSLDVSDWINLKPMQLSPELEDENGKVEGWFRARIKLDTSFEPQQFYLDRQMWSAMDVYLDGSLVASFGQTNLETFKEYNPRTGLPVPIQLNPGEEYTLSFHIVDYSHFFLLREVRLRPKNLENLLNISTSAFRQIRASEIRTSYLYGSAAITITAFLMLFFWVLAWQNPNERIFKLIALLTGMVFINAVTQYLNYLFDPDYTVKIVNGVVWAGVAPLVVSTDLMIVETIMKKKVPFLSIVILVLFVPSSILAHTYDISVPFSIVNSIFLIYFFYLVLTSWKSLQKAQISVVLGTIINIVSIMVWITLHKHYPFTGLRFGDFFLFLYFLSIPISLLAYVAFRFNGILSEVRQKAHELVKLSDEKKAILADQNIKLEKQVEERTRELNQSLQNLKSTQTQLIQSEKMASLGELTAGIAHEIQNPLNFVNNFSELSNELIKEIQDIRRKTQDKGGDGLEDEILKDIEQNLEKITHHGKRASGIVKGMLEHSRSGDGQKEPTDINALSDEYLRLAYHGLRAKDKSFNADFKTEFDPDLPRVNVVPQDIGRVLLNLINNAFHAVSERAKNETGDYKPTVTVSTQHVPLLEGAQGEEKVIIHVQDNGPGIPENIRDKIFQPFFTTKATGQGTGLGLSLSYDIVTKGHNGTLEVESSKNQTTFTISLPVT